MNVKNCTGNLVIADDKTVKIEKERIILANCGSALLKFEKVVLNSKVPANLISLSSLLKRNWSVEKVTLEEIVLVKKGKQIIATLNENELWALPIEVIFPNREQPESEMKSNQLAMLSLTD
jgi:5-keto 4-deoxyuronate isomerase